MSSTTLTELIVGLRNCIFEISDLGSPESALAYVLPSIGFSAYREWRVPREPVRVALES